MACKKTEWWGAGVVICLERGADLHMAQRMPLPLTVSCFSKTQIGFTFLVPAYPGSPGQRAVKRVYVCMYVIQKIMSTVLQGAIRKILQPGYKKLTYYITHTVIFRHTHILLQHQCTFQLFFSLFRLSNHASTVIFIDSSSVNRVP